MKIGIVSNLYPPFAKGGAELVAQRVADELYKRGHDVFALSTKPFENMGSILPEMTEQHIGRVYRFYPLNIYHLTSAQYIPFPVKAIWHLIDLFTPSSKKVVDWIVEKEEPDIVLTHNLKGLGMNFSKELQRAGVFQIHTLHDVQLSEPSGLLLYDDEKCLHRVSPARKWYERQAKKAIGSPDIVLSPSNFLSNFYLSRGFFEKSNIKVLPNPAPEKISIERAQTPTGTIRFFFVGQMEKHKGVQLLLDILDEFDFPFEMHFAGDGTLADYVAERAKRDKRVIYHGFVRFEHIARIMTETDAVLLPSLCYENSPTVIYESFEIGVPVIASNLGGIGELVTHNQNGLLFPPGDKETLIKSMKEIVNKRDEYWSKSESIRKRAEHLSLRHYVDALESLFPQKS